MNTKSNAVHYVNKVVVLMYHFIVPEETSPSTRMISPTRFRSHLEALKNSGYNIISMENYYQFIKGKQTIPHNSVLITFDDGHDSFYQYAYPILLEYGFPATNFIKVKLADSANPAELPHITWNQMREMKKKGMSFYSHTYNHHRLASTTKAGNKKAALANRLYLEKENRLETQAEYRERVKSDLYLADKRIQEELGAQPKLLCYPYGEYNDTVIEVGKELGIELFFTIHAGINDQKQRQVFRLNSGSTDVTSKGLIEKIKQFHTEPFSSISAVTNEINLSTTLSASMSTRNKENVSGSESVQKKILMCYGKTSHTPGRFLEDAMRSIGVSVDVYEKVIDFNQIDVQSYLGVIFVESVDRSPVQVKNIKIARIPKLFWFHHADNRLAANLELAKQYKPDVILLSHSLQLAKHFPALVRFFPFAMDRKFFNCSTPLRQRSLDIAFVGSKKSKDYTARNESLKTIESYFKHQYKLSLDSKAFLNDLGKLYGNSKIVFNQTADKLKTFNMRIFEGMGCGALVLTDLVPEQGTMFDDGLHYVIYRNQNDLMDKIDYYLKNPDKAQKIATAGYNYLLANHTYEHRAEYAVSIMKQLRY